MNNNYEWIFSGIGVFAIGFLINFLVKKNKKSKVKNSNTVIINNNIGDKTNDFKKVEHISESNKNLNDKLKDNTHILFIDDNHTEYKMVSILKKSGWTHTKSVKDVIDLDDPKVNESDIIFVDINGVGTSMFKDQGLGLASALKKKYPKKGVVLYSAETVGDRFHKALREVDDCLPKNAEPIQFINLIETYASKN
jgi:DNA-binding NarL/FixJ family response regulator